MVKTKLEKELRLGNARFSLLGTAIVDDKTFPKEDTVSDSGWKYRRAYFAVKVGNNNYQYVELMGGRASDNPVIYTFNKDKESIKVKWDLRSNETVLENIPDREFIKIRIETPEGKDKSIEKRFLSPVDAIDYLADHLKDGMKINVRGNIEYQQYNGQIQQRLNIERIYLAKEDSKEFALMTQTYLADSNTLPRTWKKDMEEGQIKANLFVPQYVSKYNGKKVKKTFAMPQQVVIKNKNDEAFKRIIEKLFVVKKGVVRQINLINQLFFGYESETGNIEITPEVQDLIDAGIMTLEQVQEEATVTSNRVEEIIFDHPVVSVDDNGKTLPLVQDIYAPEALLVLDDEEDEDIDTFESASKTEEQDSDDDEEVFDDEDLFA